MFPNSVGFGSQVSALWGICGSTGLKLQPTVTEKRKLRDCKEERAGSPVPIFPPLRFRIMRMLMGFYSEVSGMRVERG